MVIYYEKNKKKLIYQQVVNTLHTYTIPEGERKKKKKGRGLREQINQFCPKFLKKIP